jgi:RNase P subunit RPR2
VAKETHMTARIICPHCHSPLDPHTMDAASTAEVRLRICPECDEPIVLATTVRPRCSAAPAIAPFAENAAQ